MPWSDVSKPEMFQNSDKWDFNETSIKSSCFKIEEPKNDWVGKNLDIYTLCVPRNKEETARTLKKQLAKVIKTIDKYFLIPMRNKGSARKFVRSTHEQDIKNMFREHKAISEVAEAFSASLFKKGGIFLLKNHSCGGLIKWSESERMLDLTEKINSHIGCIHPWDPKEIKVEIAELLIMVYALLLKLHLYLKTQGWHEICF